MGTNYYWQNPPCPLCGSASESLHIGKSSAGWTFSFHGTDSIRSYKDWASKFASGVIVDECGNKLTPLEFAQLVESKRGNKWNHARDVYDDDSDFTLHTRQQSPSYRAPHNSDSWLDEEGNSFSGGEFS